MAERYEELLDAGVRLVAISVDSVGQNAAMVEKLDLPFPFLSDPNRALAIGPLGLRDERDPREIAIPAIVLLDQEGDEVWRWTARDYADRIDEDAVVAAAHSLDLDRVEPEPIAGGTPEPGPRAVKMDTLHVYFRGARFAVVAMRRRHESMREDGMAFIEEMDRYLEALKRRRERLET